MTDAERAALERRKHPGILLHRLLPRGRVLEVELQTFDRARLCLGPLESLGYDETWDYGDAGTALLAAATWDGEGEPSGWIRHVEPHLRRARYRPDGDPSREWIKPAD